MDFHAKYHAVFGSRSEMDLGFEVGGTNVGREDEEEEDDGVGVGDGVGDGEAEGVGVDVEVGEGEV